MKKNVVLIIALILSLLCVSAFAIEPGDVVGTWYLNALEMGGASMNPATLGIEMTITFNEDGSAAILAVGEDDENGTWTIENDVVVLKNGESDTTELVLDGEQLFVDMGDEGKMVFGKEKAEASVVEIAPALVVSEISDFNGEWVGVQIDFLGTFLPLEMAEMMLSFTVADGVVQINMLHGGEEVKGEVKGELKDGALVTAIERTEASQDVTMRLHEDGTLSFSLGLEGIGMTIYCEKVVVDE